MKSKIINVLMFAAGAAVGSAVTWKIVKSQYDKIVQEEIESIKEAFKDLPSNDQDEENPESKDEERPSKSKQINWAELEDLDEEEDDDRKEYEQLASNYTSEEGGVENMVKTPYVISPYDFGEIDTYHQIELTYYEGDDVLEDDEGNVVDDRTALIGDKALSTFGEYEDDAVFVRNEQLSTDFQILKDYRSWEEARNTNPYTVGHE